jgi:hypothetical protein
MDAEADLELDSRSISELVALEASPTTESRMPSVILIRHCVINCDWRIPGAGEYYPVGHSTTLVTGPIAAKTLSTLAQVFITKIAIADL